MRRDGDEARGECAHVCSFACSPLGLHTIPPGAYGDCIVANIAMLRNR